MKRRTRRLVWLPFVAAVLLTIGCVSSPETKLASSQYKTAIDDYARNVEAFEDAWIAELDKAIDDVGEALAARAVTLKVQSLSVDGDGFSEAGERKEFKDDGLIALSRVIENERERIAKFLTVVDKFTAENLDGVRELIRSASFPADEETRLLADLSLGPAEKDPVAQGLVDVLMTLRKSRRELPDDLANLKTIVDALRKTHAEVDAWIQTDVTVPGEDVADLVKTWSETMGDK